MSSKIRFQFIEPESEMADKKQSQPASYIRKSFYVKDAVLKATLHMTALGVYKGYLNGEETDEQMLLPGFTNYRKRVQYQSYDVTDKIVAGENVIAAVVGDGWYRGCLGIKSSRGFYGDKIKFAAVLELEGKDGITYIRTDESWKAVQEGPILVNDLKTYETVDMRKEMPGWNASGYDDGTWHHCRPASYQGETIPHEGERILEQERFAPEIIQTPNGETVLDFSQNLSGHVEFTVTGKEGTKVALSMGETLDEHGNFTVKNLQAEGSERFAGELGQKLTYILKEGTQTYKSMFLISGYRYVKIDNWPEDVRPENFTSIAVYSDLKETGRFSCSNEKINQLLSNVRWSQKSNFVDIPTDCPTRERAGWTGDINVFSETASFFTDTRKFLKKWIRDFKSLQTPEGSLPFIVPEVPFELLPVFDCQNIPYGSAGWSDGLCNIPMVLYKFYGEREILEEVYEPVKRFVEYNLRRAKKRNFNHLLKWGRHYNYIVDTGFHWGEWLEPGSVMVKDGTKALFTPDAEVATAWFFHTTKQLSQMAEILGMEEDRKKYKTLAKTIRAAYQKEFLKNGRVRSKRQCRYVRPLAMGLVDREMGKAIAADLNQMCIANGYKLGTGFLTTYKLLFVLCDYGYIDTAYHLLENEECPGWLYEVKKGATTTWENWIGINESNIPIDSHNHYAPGACAAWLFEYCAGIRAMSPGFEKIRIQPLPGGSLKWAKAEYDSCKGKIVSEWKIENGRFYLHVEVPEGITAQVILPDGTEDTAAGGNGEWNCSF